MRARSAVPSSSTIAPGLSRPSALIVGQRRHVLPTVRVALRIRIEAQDRRLHAVKSRLRMHRPLHESHDLPPGELRRQRLRKRRVLPTAGRKPVTTREHQHRAAALIDELFQQSMLLGTQAGGFVAADHHGVVGEQLCRAHRKSFAQLRRRVDALAVVLVRRGAHHARDAQRAIAFRGAPHELVFPARLAFDVKNIAPGRRHIDDARARVVDGVALAFERIEREAQLVRARLAGRQIDRQARRGRVAAAVECRARRPASRDRRRAAASRRHL